MRVGPVHKLEFAGAWPLELPGRTQFAYDDAGRLTSYENPNGGISATYAYDALGQRTQKVVTEGGVETTTTFTYEGLTLHRLSATETGGESASSWEITYLYDEYARPYGGIYRSPLTNTTPVFFALVTSDRGDVLSLLDEAGTPFASYRYDAWGAPHGAGNFETGIWTQATSLIDEGLAAAIATRQPLRYAGYFYDEENTLYYLSARYYDPATRQFITKDPAKADGEGSAYQYGGGDPVGRVDPSGALSVTGVADGGWELVVRSPFLNQTIPTEPTGGAEAEEPPIAGGAEIRIEVGPDFLPRKMTIVVETGFAGDDTATYPAAPEFPERVTTETVYRIEHIAPLTESDVALSPPPGIEVTERSVDLPLDHPRADVSWPHYWLGSEFLGVPLSGALFAVSDLDAAEPTEFISLSYGEWDAPLDEAGLPTAGLIDVQQGPHRAGEPDPFTDLLGMAGPFETEQRVVAGREATVLSRVTEAPSPMEGPPAFEVLVQFPDVTVYLQGGVDGGTVDALLAALQQL